MSPRPARPLPAALLALATWVASAPSAPETATVDLDDFETGLQGWRYVGGEEFPGAKGSLAREGGAAVIAADFGGGGAYVGGWRDLAGFAVRDLVELRLRVKAEGLAAIGVRINDATGQCHQRKGIPLAATADWQEVVLKVADIAGGEHWGGANDGRWHGPAQGFGLNLAKDGLAAGATRGALRIDGIRATIEPAGRATILPCALSAPACRPAHGLKITYRWDAEPMGCDNKVFVHIIGPGGELVTQHDHEPPVPTSQWTGRVEYTKTLVLPTDAAVGDYEIRAGLYAPKGGARQAVRVAEGLAPAGEHAWRIGTFRVAHDAPVPPLPAPSLNLDGWRLTFDESFDGAALDVSAHGPGTRWIAHTPYGGDFGDARFADPESGFPFTLSNGVLRIEARKDGGRWRAGLLSSVDAHGDGFAQRYGYFEMRAKFPAGAGTWPAFWLLGVPKLKDRTVTQIEIDVVEQYGVHPNALHTTVHLWGPGGRHMADGEPFLVEGMADDFHRYGVMVDEREIAFYYDGVELRRTKTPPEARVPLYLLVDLALGGGWPIAETPDPSFMYVDYVRAWAR